MASGYINNRDLIAAVKRHRSNPEDRANNEYLGTAFLKIARNFGKKESYNQYTWLDDMIGDAVLRCWSRINNFDPDRSKNPFAYFTQVTWSAFIKRLKKEKKHGRIRDKMLERHRNTYTGGNSWNSL